MKSRERNNPKEVKKIMTTHNTLSDRCKEIESISQISNDELFRDFNLMSGNPWEEVISLDITTYYRCLFHFIQKEKPKKILEIGTAFGMSAATMIKASPDIELFITIDLGIFGEQYGFSQNNIDYARTRVHSWCCKQGIPLDRIRFYRANSQPQGVGDNDDIASDIIRWHQIPDLVRLLTQHEFDVIFVDGKHTDNGLLNDLDTVWPLIKEGGLIVCDDLHDEATYKDIFPWAGQTLASFNTFLNSHSSDIDDFSIWNFPHVIPADFTGLRPFGFIRKKKREISSSVTGSGFEVFDSPEALEINYARQDHLASLGLDLAQKRVLEVGAGIGRHTTFFEKLGCTVFSTDARQENVDEHIRRYPHRKDRVEMADLNRLNSHKKFGSFEIVYCYGTLYHLDDPAHCIKELAENCGGLFLLETCVNPEDNGQVNNVSENAVTKNQSFSGKGCRPARDWIMNELKKYYPFVYYSKSQPHHPDYPLRWPAPIENVNNTRAVFIGSKKPIINKTLTLNLLQLQIPVEDILMINTARKNTFSNNTERITIPKEPRFSIPIPFFYKKGTRLSESFEYNLYGDDYQSSIELVKNRGVFQPTTINDHISLPYFNLFNKSKNNTVRIRITMMFRSDQKPGDSFSFSLQDEQFRVVYSSPPVVISSLNGSTLCQVITLKAEFEKIRLLIQGTHEMRIPVPVSLKVEKMLTIF